MIVLEGTPSLEAKGNRLTAAGVDVVIRDRDAQLTVDRLRFACTLEPATPPKLTF
jgi:hypothetical protein